VRCEIQLVAARSVLQVSWGRLWVKEGFKRTKWSWEKEEILFRQQLPDIFMAIGSTNRNFKSWKVRAEVQTWDCACPPDFLWTGRDLDMNFVFQMRAFKLPSFHEYLVKSGASWLNCSQSTSDNQEALNVPVIALSRAVHW
jgi:hypothetical protein